MAATMHENLISTMALRAGQMEAIGSITLPSGVSGEDRIADYCADKVREYEMSGSDEPFDLFIEEALTKRFGPQERTDKEFTR